LFVGGFSPFEDLLWFVGLGEFFIGVGPVEGLDGAFHFTV
jgi:hypothetical protein